MNVEFTKQPNQVSQKTDNLNLHKSWDMIEEYFYNKENIQLLGAETHASEIGGAKVLLQYRLKVLMQV